jgi:hypothetical protein
MNTSQRQRQSQTGKTKGKEEDNKHKNRLEQMKASTGEEAARQKGGGRSDFILWLISANFSNLVFISPFVLVNYGNYAAVRKAQNCTAVC